MSWERRWSRGRCQWVDTIQPSFLRPWAWGSNDDDIMVRIQDPRQYSKNSHNTQRIHPSTHYFITSTRSKSTELGFISGPKLSPSKKPCSLSFSFGCAPCAYINSDSQHRPSLFNTDFSLDIKDTRAIIHEAAKDWGMKEKDLILALGHSVLWNAIMLQRSMRKSTEPTSRNWWIKNAVIVILEQRCSSCSTYQRRWVFYSQEGIFISDRWANSCCLTVLLSSPSWSCVIYKVLYILHIHSVLRRN